MGNRYEPRASVRLPVTVSGTDADGNPFTQTAYASNVSRRGARLDGIGCLRGPGETIELEHKGRKAKFFVVWTGLPGTQEESQIGVRLLERNKSIWAVDVPKPQVDDFVPAEPVEETVWDNEPDADRDDEGDDARSALIQHLRQQKELQEPETTGDRRQYRRYAVDGSAELYMKGSQTRTWGPLTDISASGCYVEMYAPYIAELNCRSRLKLVE